MGFSFYQDFMIKKQKFLEKKYDIEIRKECEHLRILLNDCMRRVKNEKECGYNILNFNDCVKNFDRKFKLYYKL